MAKEEFDFYSKSNMKSYNLNESMRYQLSLLDSLDVYTKKHCENVALLCQKLCEFMHLNEEFTIYCTICAYLHDIGKLYIPSSILQKQAKLTEEEYNTMKNHTVMGYDICFKDLKLRSYANGARYHHENLDGSGYPDGITDIPLEAQIIKVADVFDALVSKRQYKTHIDISKTLEILIEEANFGKSNKQVTKALLKLVTEDTLYEISMIMYYMENVKKEIDRLDKIVKFSEDSLHPTFFKSKMHYEIKIAELIKEDEKIEDCPIKSENLKHTYELRQQQVDKLYKEVEIIKKLKV